MEDLFTFYSGGVRQFVREDGMQVMLYYYLLVAPSPAACVTLLHVVVLISLVVVVRLHVRMCPRAAHARACVVHCIN